MMIDDLTMMMMRRVRCVFLPSPSVRLVRLMNYTKFEIYYQHANNKRQKLSIKCDVAGTAPNGISRMQILLADSSSCPHVALAKYNVVSDCPKQVNKLLCFFMAASTACVIALTGMH